VSDSNTRLSAQDYIALMRQRRQAEDVAAATQVQPSTHTQPPIQVQQPAQTQQSQVIYETQPQAADYTSNYPSDDEIDSDPYLTDAEKAEVKRSRSAFVESDMFPGQFVPIPEEDILVWEAPSRPYKKRDRQYYTTIAVIVFLLSLILFFAGQFLPIAVVIAVGFLAYVLSAVPPVMVKNKITTWGLRIEDQIYYWEEMGRFWFTDKYKQKMFHVEIARFPGRITIMLADQTEAEITEILSQVLIKQKPEPTAFDKAADWLQKKIPIDTSEI
jgi:hypothetical protein